MRAVTIVFMVVAPDLSGEHRADPVLWAKCLHRRFGSASSDAHGKTAAATDCGRSMMAAGSSPARVTDRVGNVRAVQRARCR